MFSFMKKGLTCIHRETLAALREAHQPEAYTNSKTCYSQWTGCDIWSRSHRHFIKKSRNLLQCPRRGRWKKAVTVVNSRTGTRTEHHLVYLSSIMYVLDRNNMNSHYLVMDNGSIQTPAVVGALIENKGNKCLYLPPYSSFPNPIEERWAK